MTEVVHSRECLRLNFGILTATGAWMPAEYSGTRKAVYYRIFSCVALFIEFFWLLLAQIIDIYLNMGDVEKMVETAALMCTLMCELYKMMTMIGKQDKIRKLADTLDEPMFSHVKKEHSKHLKSWMWFVRAVALTYFAEALMTACMFAAAPMLDKTSNRTLPLRAWSPLDIRNKYSYIMVYTYQSLAVTISASLNTSVDMMVSGFMALACAQLDVLCAELSSLGRDSSGNQSKISRKDRLRKCVRHHEGIRKYVEELEDLFSSTLCIQFAASCLAICITAFQLSLAPINLKFVGTSLYMTSIIVQLLLYCYHGNEIILKSLRINGAAYDCLWYDEDQEFKQILIIMMERSKRPLHVTAANMFTLHLQTFTAILRSSYSYYAVLQSSQEVEQ